MATTATAKQESQIHELHERGDLSIAAIARAVGLSRDIVKNIIDPPPDVPRDMDHKAYYWPHVAPRLPARSAQVVLDYRLTRAERAALQHSKKVER